MTLIETMVSVGVGVVVVAGLWGGYTYVSRYGAENAARASAQSELNLVAQHVAQDFQRRDGDGPGMPASFRLNCAAPANGCSGIQIHTTKGGAGQTFVYKTACEPIPANAGPAGADFSSVRSCARSLCPAGKRPVVRTVRNGATLASPGMALCARLDAAEESVILRLETVVRTEAGPRVLAKETALSYHRDDAVLLVH